MTNSLEEYWKFAWTNTETEIRERVGNDMFGKEFRTANKRKPEGKEWWYTNGLEMLKNYRKWRETSDWKIWTAPDGKPAIELNMLINFGNTPVKMALDRIMQMPDGELVVLDLKTGSRTPSTTLQLGFYSVGIELTYGIKPKFGSYWMARKGEPTPVANLEWYTTDRLIRLAEMFNRARYEALFVPNISNCSLCGYTQHCEWYRKEEDKTNV